jgi:predicted AAA+ superfamily ATPase
MPLAARYLKQQLQRDLERKMVFLGGPRQVGKTTLAKSLLFDMSRPRAPTPESDAMPTGYLNWDVPLHRADILERKLPHNLLWVFDELHKYRNWRNYLKGLFDGRTDMRQQILVTGSARLDWYRLGGDSLQGRYHYLRLHPLSLAELGNDSWDTLRQLFQLGGFPEPFFTGTERESRRWSLEYRDRLIREDIASIENISDLSRLELLLSALPERVGSPLSINSLREDLGVSQPTVARWLDVFERTYGIFRLAPFGAPRLRAVKKERKHYHFDWTLIKEPGPRFENLVAVHLQKWVHFQRDTEGLDYELRYFRDVDGREVDFIVVDGRTPIVAVECKIQQGSVGKGLNYLRNKFPALEAWQISYEPSPHRVAENNIHLACATELLRQWA